MDSVPGMHWATCWGSRRNAHTFSTGDFTVNRSSKIMRGNLGVLRRPRLGLRAATQPAGTWIRGRGYDQSRLAERRHPNRLDWDAVASDHPVIFIRTCGHIASVNSRALAGARIPDETPDPPGGRYDRADGK